MGRNWVNNGSNSYILSIRFNWTKYQPISTHMDIVLLYFDVFLYIRASQISSRAPPDLPRGSQSQPRPPEPPRTAWAIAWRFFDFLRDVRNGIIGFETTFEGSLSKSGLKTYGFVRDIPKKVKQTLHRSVTRVTFAVKTEGKCTIWNSSDYPDYPPDQVSESATGTPPSTRAGGQDDGS